MYLNELQPNLTTIIFFVSNVLFTMGHFSVFPTSVSVQDVKQQNRLFEGEKNPALSMAYLERTARSVT